MIITKNALVTMDYRLTNSKDELLNPDKEPLIYLHGGYGYVFKKVEKALEGKAVADSVHVTLKPDEAFGDYDEDLIVKEDLSELPEGLAVGMEIEGSSEESPDEITVYTVKEVQGSYAILDGNHPMAGETLTFEGTVKDVQALDEEAVQEILAHNHHH